MAHTESKKAVIAAIIGNAAIAVIKFVAASMTGSSAMLSEGIHSLVDTGNGALLFLGIKRSSRPPSVTHPFGYGKELYFWSLIVAISIFGIGGGMSIYEGILHIQHPSELTNPTINYIVLGLAMIFESFSFTVAYRAFRTMKGDRRAISAIHHGKDPSLFTVLFEDTAALAGLVVAFVGVFLAHQLDNPYIDGTASIVIGSILCVVAVWLAWESKGLLVGESADPHLVDDVRRFAGDDPVVTGVGAVLTMHLGPEEVLLNLEVEFAPGTPAEEIHAVDPPHRGAHHGRSPRGEPHLHRGRVAARGERRRGAGGGGGRRGSCQHGRWRDRRRRGTGRLVRTGVARHRQAAPRAAGLTPGHRRESSLSVSASAGFAPSLVKIARACSSTGAASGALPSATRQRPCPSSACASS